ncbi:MAG: hypothetical protein RBG13Loki_2482 [Promethearchaeota archaeon CR_4]|nr:MAG: hypothetical protein RBG13Loki_2482 [Candidatus Lokiarchaeota archaeon CR_4]
MGVRDSMYCPILKNECIGIKCTMWNNRSCLLLKSLKNSEESRVYLESQKNSEESRSYLESHSIEEIAQDYADFLETILFDEKMTDRDFFVEECFWSDKIGDEPLPPDLERKRLEVIQFFEQKGAESFLGEFIKMSSSEFAEKIVDWATNKNLTRLSEEEIEMFWKDRFGIEFFPRPQTPFQQKLYEKAIRAGEIAISMFNVYIKKV